MKEARHTGTNGESSHLQAVSGRVRFMEPDVQWWLAEAGRRGHWGISVPQRQGSQLGVRKRFWSWMMAMVV